MGKPKNSKLVSFSFLYKNKKYSNPRYSSLKRNCVQVSIEVLLKGTFYNKKGKKDKDIDAFKRAIIKYVLSISTPAPNDIYSNLAINYFFQF